MKELNINGQDFLTPVFFLRARCHFYQQPLTTPLPLLSGGPREQGGPKVDEGNRGSLPALEEARDGTVQMPSSFKQFFFLKIFVEHLQGRSCNKTTMLPTLTEPTVRGQGRH